MDSGYTKGLWDLGDDPLSDNRNFRRGLNRKGKLGFKVSLLTGYSKAWILLTRSLVQGRCYIGPFKGEFGHFLGHCLPFIYYLHSKGVKVNYCGLGMQEDFFKDSNGELILEEFHRLRDFFSEVSPSGNSTQAPDDVQGSIKAFEKKARSSRSPFWNLGDPFFYWFILRNWLADNPWLARAPRLDRVWKEKEENAVTIFPRKKGQGESKNNGGPWDYQELARALSPYFDKVYMVGHPALSEELRSEGNIEVVLEGGNPVMLRKCSNSRLIVTQHSGANYLGEYLNKTVLIIYNGGPPIGSWGNTLRFKEQLGGSDNLEVAFSLEEVLSFVEEFQAVSANTNRRGAEGAEDAAENSIK